MKKTSKRFRLNAVDVTISLVLILLVLTFIIFYNNVKSDISNSINDNTVIEVEILTDVIDDRFVGNLKVGDTLLSSADRTIIGTVKHITQVDSQLIETSENKKSTYKRGKKLKIKYVGNAMYNGNHYLVNNEKMIIGQIYSYVAPGLEFSAECISLNTIKNSNGNFDVFSDFSRG